MAWGSVEIPMTHRWRVGEDLGRARIASAKRSKVEPTFFHFRKAHKPQFLSFQLQVKTIDHDAQALLARGVALDDHYSLWFGCEACVPNGLHGD